ncbi:MAG: GNAT family N-acetyltransferase [Pirellulales bacterium]|nr:GNAT family N-acetyltransferase [Pirellulales bacterium]
MRLLEPHHAEELFALVDANREMLREWLPWVDASQSADDSRAFIEDSLRKLADQKSWTAGVWSDGRCAGVVGAAMRELGPTAEVGYWLGAEFQGRGLMTRAVSALLAYLFDERELNRVEIQCALQNVRSCAVAERLGFQLEGVRRQADKIGERFLDLNHYALLRSEWQARK